MATITWRWDYAKFLVVCPSGTFNHYYNGLCNAARQRKWDKPWDSSHKVQALPNFTPEWDRTAVEIWGTPAGVVELLDYAVWSQWIVRLDVRAVQWDVDEDAVLYTGQRLQRTIINRNIEVFSSKNASKREGRDRGGKGFRIGSRKSDRCIVVYKRKGDNTAAEYRFTGQALRNHLHHIDDTFDSATGTANLWLALQNDLVRDGNKLFQNVMAQAGIGDAWRLYDHKTRDDYEALQHSFVAQMKSIDAEEHSELHWSDSDWPEVDTGPGRLLQP